MDIFAVFIGGFFGALLREAVVRLFGAAQPAFATVTVNLIGSFIFVFLATLLLESFKVEEKISLGIFTGFLGAFTTFSAFARDIFVFINRGEIFLSLIYVALSTGGGFILASMARRLAISMVNPVFAKNAFEDE